MRITVPLAAFAVLVVALGPRLSGEPAAVPGSTLVFVSEFGDPVGQGRTRSFEAHASAHAAGNTVRVHVDNDDDPDSAGRYELTLQAPEGEPLRPGVYAVDDTTDIHEPRMHFRSGGRSCDRVEGRFEIESIDIADDGAVEQLIATLEQRCNGAFATLWAEVSVHAPGAAEPVGTPGRLGHRSPPAGR